MSKEHINITPFLKQMKNQLECDDIKRSKCKNKFLIKMKNKHTFMIIEDNGVYLYHKKLINEDEIESYKKDGFIVKKNIAHYRYGISNESFLEIIAAYIYHLSTKKNKK